MNILPKGINKIIEEYCWYQLSFMKELHEETLCILGDVNELWSYDKYYTEINSGIKNFLSNYGIIKKYYGWKVGFKSDFN